MKKIVKIQLYICIILSGLFFRAEGQQLYNGRLSFPGELVQRNDSMYLRMNIDYTNLEVYRNQSLVFTPVLVGSGRRMEYPSVMLNGKVRQKAWKRAEVLDDETRMNMKNYYAIVDASGNSRNNRTITYLAALPYEDWMQGGRIDLIEQIEGCGKSMDLVVENIINAHVNTYNWKAIAAYSRPASEEVKRRGDRFEAYLEFVVARTEIRPDFHNNRAELTQLEGELAKIQNDKNLSVTHIAISGFASPEGSVALNDRLSEGRAEALLNYLSGKFHFPRDVYSVQKGGEDWEKLEQLVEQSTNLPAKSEILNIIKTTADPTQRQAKLTQLQGGVPYRQLLSEYYPKLRRSLCVVDYTVRAFSVEEARNIIKTNPRQLSLDEMYQVAQSYPQGSEAYNEAFDIAIRMYPNDPDANMNAAAVALSERDADAARIYLNKTNKNSAEYYNNEGILYLLSDDFKNAEQSFRRGADMGSSAARQNLELLNTHTSTGY
ncbi:MAG: DUF3868 domain-containing protein [Tannerellaceae bacterium]|nr:DUF3868 domain-containing protein [Tannerellaceae bacterium]